MDRDIQIEKPFETAFSRMADFCFRPFELSKWLVMGFVTWVVFLGEGGGGGGNFSFPSGNHDSGGSIFRRMDNPSEFFQNFWHSIQEEIQGWLALIIVAVVVIIIISIVVWILVCWLKSRFEFIFLDNLIHNRAVVSEPWNKFKKAGNSLFKWNIFFSMLNFFLMTPLVLAVIAVPLIMCWDSIRAGHLLPGGVNGIIIGAALLCLTIILALALGVVGAIVRQLIIPVMYRRNMTITEAWHALKPALSANKGSLALFILIYWALAFATGIAAVIAIFIIMLLTCCFCCLGMIPFLGTYISFVLLLPVNVFFRYFSYEYACQFDLDEKTVGNVYEYGHNYGPSV